MTTQIRSGNSALRWGQSPLAILPTNIEKCNFLFVDGERIGTYCNQPAQWIDGNRKRCDGCKNSSWPEATYQCTRILTRGKNKGSPCGSNTKFSDSKCSRCRKIKTTVRRCRVNKLAILRTKEIMEKRKQNVLPKLPELPKLDSMDSAYTDQMLMSASEASHFGLPTYHPVEDEVDGRHPCECPKI